MGKIKWSSVLLLHKINYFKLERSQNSTAFAQVSYMAANVTHLGNTTPLIGKINLLQCVTEHVKAIHTSTNYMLTKRCLSPSQCVINNFCQLKMLSFKL